MFFVVRKEKSPVVAKVLLRFKIQKFNLLPTYCTCVFRLSPTTN